LTDGQKVLITERVRESIDDQDDRSFCVGRAAARRGDGEECNPFPRIYATQGSAQWYESDHGLWLAGHAVGSGESGGLLWYGQPNRGCDSKRPGGRPE
jgi:hypothetical protein